MNIMDLDEDLREKAMACKTQEEMMAFAKKHGYELGEEELTRIAGGDFWCNQCAKDALCPKLS